MVLVVSAPLFAEWMNAYIRGAILCVECNCVFITHQTKHQGADLS